MVDGSHEFMQISMSRREKVYHVIAVWSCDQCSDHVTLNKESPRISHPLLWGRHKWIRGPTRARGAIGIYLTNDDLSRHCGTGKRQKYDDLVAPKRLKSYYDRTMPHVESISTIESFIKKFVLLYLKFLLQLGNGVAGMRWSNTARLPSSY